MNGPRTSRGDGVGPSADRKPVIGVAGAPGAGKSVVARLLVERGGRLIDADQIARRQLQRPEVLKQLRAWWGEGVFVRGAEPQRIDRRKVAEIVFQDAAAKQRLERLIHPLVAEERQKLRQAAQKDPAIGFVVEDVPLLFETGLDAECDWVFFVDADRPVRETRVRETRGWEPQELARREASQMPLDTKRLRSDHCLKNNGSMFELTNELNRVLHQIGFSDSGS